MARSPTSSSRSLSFRDSHSSSSRRSSSHHHHSSSSKRSRDRESIFTVRKHKKGRASSHSVNVFAQAAVSSFAYLLRQTVLNVPTVDEAPSAEIKDRLQRLNAWKKQSQPVAQPEEPQPTLEERSTNESLAVDPLDLYMQSLVSESSEITELQQLPETEPERYFGAQEVYSEDDFDEKPDEGISWMVQREKKFKKKEIKKTDHSKMNYVEFRKEFYVEPKEITAMTEEEIADYRKNELEGVQIRGKDCPRPIKRWTQCGLNATTLQLLQKYGYTAPFPIQAQAIPVIMSGRDCLACAKTGSGKTMAFVLPMVRHILDQPPISETDGPITLILAPTRELAIQIHNEVRRFCKPVGLRSVCCYGGAAVSEQIATLKRGAEIIVATPGRFIDMLCMNQGRVTNLKRCTYVVLDEADRMFDLGFEPQISAILVNVRPDRQTVMFSATFPKQIEGLAKKALKNPVEIVIGGRSVASNTVVQSIEVLEYSEKQRRLLQLLGQWYEKGSILIFVDRQESVDILFRDLTASGYLCLSLHGGMDQADRDYTILDFKKKVRTILIATSVAARGLDVKELIAVINYNVPNHYEDYIHRIGRTGRAGNKGYSFTFITPDEERFAPDMMKALETSNQPVPDTIRNLATAFKEKVSKGEVQFSSNSGYSSAKGFKFDEKESLLKLQEQARQKKSFGLAEDQEVEEVESTAFSIVADDAKEKLEAVAAASTAAPAVGGVEGQIASLKAALAAAKSKNASESDKKAAVAAAKAKAAAMSLQMAMETLPSVQLLGDMGPEPDFFTDELEINDYPQQARWKVTARGSLNEMLEKLDVSVTTKGTFIPSGRHPGVGERKLHVVIEGKSKMDVHLAKKEIKRILEEAAIQSKPDEKEQYVKYTVV